MNRPAQPSIEPPAVRTAISVTGKPLVLKPCCLNLRHKMMYVDPAQATPGWVDDNSDTRVYICLRTQDVLGPDEALVSPSKCDSSGRGCFQGSARPITPTISAQNPGAV